ncbi:hypothetical protein G9A89_000148 [Geosiphon pyriformis]|nr:hypothetical protein G9A89_000148 [Geosiphon pyriformis]
MKKIAKDSGAGGSFRSVLSRKKRKGGVLAESILVEGGVIETTGNHSQNSETGDITESESVDMEEECLIEKTSINYSERDVFDSGDLNQTPKSSDIKIKTKKVLGKPLGKINFEDGFDNNDFLDESALFPPPLLLKLSVHVSVHKSFTLDINLVAIAGKSSQKKLNFIKKIFSDVNSFERAFTSSKFGGIICVTFTSEMAMMAVEKLAYDCGVVVNTDLKHLEIPVGTSIEAVRTAVFEFGVVVLIKMQLVGLWQKTIADLLASKADVDKQTWNSKDEFKILLVQWVGKHVSSSAIQLTTVGHTAPQCLHLFAALCSSCNFLGHTSRNCKSAGVFSSPKGKRAPLSAQDQFRLVKIYERKSALVSHLLAFGGKTWALMLGSIRNGKPFSPVVNDLKKCLVSIESSLVSLVRQIGELAKRLELFMSAVSQSSSGCQLPVTLSLQNQGEDIVMGVGLSNATSNKTAAVLGSTASSEIVKLENMLEGLFALVMSLSACLDGLALAGSAPSLPLS